MLLLRTACAGSYVGGRVRIGAMAVLWGLRVLQRRAVRDVKWRASREQTLPAVRVAKNFVRPRGSGARSAIVTGLPAATPQLRRFL